MKIIGITGKIGSGKSTVGRLLEGEGALRIDCDKVVHDLYEPGGKGAQKIQTFFGEEFLLKSGAVNRNKLKKVLIKTPKKWEILNRLIHPLVAEELKKRLHKEKTDIAIIEIPIFNENRFGPLIDELWVIEADKSIRHKRLKGQKKEEVEAMEKQQNQLRIPKTAITLANNDSKEALEQKVKALV